MQRHFEAAACLHQRVRCLVAAVNGIALRRAGEIDDGDREREFAFRTAEPLESVPAVETQTLRSRIGQTDRSEEHTSELQSLMRISDAVFCLKKKNKKKQNPSLSKLNTTSMYSRIEVRQW